MEVLLKTIIEHPFLREKITIVDEVKEGKRRDYRVVGSILTVRSTM
ncbi:MAG: hypothetical protein ABSH06_06710 [Thermodesulfobacteriota bacterium]